MGLTQISPFCGADAQKTFDPSLEESSLQEVACVEVLGFWDGPINKYYNVVCNVCGAKGPHGTNHEGAKRQWNRRK